MSMTSTSRPQFIAPELAYIDGRFVRGARIGIDTTGRIAQIDLGGVAGQTNAANCRQMPRRALLPGFVNVHSHAFQRALRGHGETYPVGMGDFWSWRVAMYALVESLTPRQLHQVTLQAFREMLAAGYTTVGEYHYVHHENAAGLDFAFDRIILEAAAEAGIRLVLLLCYYKTGGVGQPLAGGQLRFSTPDVDAFFRQFDALAALLHPGTQTIGIAPHSLRAVPGPDMVALCAEARRRGLLTHVHVEEQVREITDVEAALHRTPLDWLCDNVALGRHFTAIHCTHATPARLKRYLATGARVCLCPLTEGNLGDGMPAFGEMLQHPDSICIGSDSNIRIDPFEEMRWLEFGQRLRNQKRGLARTSTCDNDIARQLLQIGTRNGAAALGLAAGEIKIGNLADLVALDLDHRSLSGWTEPTLLATAITGAGADVVREMCVGGNWIKPPL